MNEAGTAIGTTVSSIGAISGAAVLFCYSQQVSMTFVLAFGLLSAGLFVVGTAFKWYSYPGNE